jgi:hypothetical protein
MGISSRGYCSGAARDAQPVRAFRGFAADKDVGSAHAKPSFWYFQK